MDLFDNFVSVIFQYLGYICANDFSVRSFTEHVKPTIQNDLTVYIIVWGTLITGFILPLIRKFFIPKQLTKIIGVLFNHFSNAYIGILAIFSITCLIASMVLLKGGYYGLGVLVFFYSSFVFWLTWHGIKIKNAIVSMPLRA